ncbi:hypothetical protein IWX49DRAFT_593689 [Phyllosticta citricarpa]|uniref:Rhodopsin domain-containing protein n=2 Tax=Phyllosticta TaxID=121621 RepID=A0ABR1LPR0_9PEZI
MVLQKYPIFGIPLIKHQIIACAVLMSLATVLVCLRFVARCFRRQKVWWDDGWIIAALVFAYLMQAMQISYARYGIRYEELPLENQLFLGKHLVMDQCIYYCCIAFTKQSYLCFYSRIFPQQQFRRWVMACSIIIWLWWASAIMQVFLICRPVQASWDPRGSRVCGDIVMAYVALCVINLFTDLVIMFLPVPFIRRLQIDTSTKIGLYVMFALGIAVTIITILRAIALARIDLWNISYSIVDSLFWSTVEPAVAITNACIPAIRPLLSIVMNRLSSSMSYLSSSQKRVGATSSGATPNDNNAPPPPLAAPSSTGGRRSALGSSSAGGVIGQWFGQTCVKSNASTRGFERMPSVGLGEQHQLDQMENGTAGIGVAIGGGGGGSSRSAPGTATFTHSKTVARAYAREQRDSGDDGRSDDDDDDDDENETGRRGGRRRRRRSKDDADGSERINVVMEVHVSNHRPEVHSAAGDLLEYKEEEWDKR